MAKLMARIPSLPAWWYAACLLLAGWAIYEARAWSELRRVDAGIADPSRVRIDSDTPAAVRLAGAVYLEREGKVQDAMRLYHELLNSEDASIREIAYYNLATLYLSDASRIWNAVGVLEHARVSTLVELAKENFREALRLDPQNWDARFNFEYAWRITPPPKEQPKSDWKGTKSSIYSTLPGAPGGGP